MRAAKRTVKIIIVILAEVVIVLSFVFGLSFCYRGLPNRPRPELGRIYPLNNHGTILYMTRHEQRQQEISFIACGLMFALLVVFDYFFDPFDRRKWSNLPNKRPPWDHRWGP